MVRKLILALILISLSLVLFASGAELNVSSLLTKVYNSSLVNSFTASAIPYYTFSNQQFKGELRGELKLINTRDITNFTLTLKRADIRFRLPSFNNKKMTITVGRSPISWGLGSYYRIGDVLLDGMSKNQKAGVTDDRNIYLISASQSLGGGFNMEVALSLPLPSTVTFNEYGSKIENSEKLAIGAKLKKSFDSKTIKSFVAFASYNEDKVTSLAAALDVAMYFDVTMGVESKLRSSNDIRAAINITKLYSIEGELSSMSLGLYLAGEADFYNKTYEACTALSLTPNERLTLYIALENKFSNTGYVSLTLTPSLNFTITESVKLEASAIYSYLNENNQNIFGGGISFKSMF